MIERPRSSLWPTDGIRRPDVFGRARGPVGCGARPRGSPADGVRGGAMGWLSELVARYRGDGPGEPLVDADTQVDSCIREEIVPALESVRDRLAEEGYAPELETGDGWARLAVMNFNELPLEYRVRGRIYNEPVVNLTSAVGMRAGDTLRRYGRIEIYRGGRTREYRPARCRRAAIEQAVLKYFHRFLLNSPAW